MSILRVPLRVHAKESWTEYAKYTIQERALPDVRDGLKPVHRRLIYAGHQLPNFKVGGKHIKSAKLVGDTMGNFHPHGDASIYNALVKLTQPFSSNLPLFEGQGNWGDVLGNRAGAMRYTEVRPSKAFDLMLEGIDKGIVQMSDNYDGTRKEPDFLPSVLPNLLINGTIGIASAMNSIFLPHNVQDSIRACILALENPDCTVEDLLEILKGPDFPTGGKIINSDDLLQVYKTGKGVVYVSGTYEVNKREIRITSLPYKVSTNQFIENLHRLIKEKALPQVKRVIPEGATVSITVQSEEDVDKVIQILSRRAGLVTSFNVNMSALNENGVVELNLKSLIEEFIKHRINMVTAELRYDLEKEKQRLSSLAAIKFAAEHKQDVMTIIATSESKADAEYKLSAKYPALTSEQIEYIVSLQLYRLTEKEAEKTAIEIQKVEASIRDIELTLGDEKKIRRIIKERLEEFLRDNTERSTELINVATYLNRKAEVEAEPSKYPEFESKQVYLQISNNTVKITSQGDISADYNDIITVIAKDGITYNIKVGELAEVGTLPVKSDDILFIGLNPQNKILTASKKGLLGYFKPSVEDREVLQIPIDESDEIIHFDGSNRDFTHIIIITNQNRFMVIPKQKIPEKLLPMPVILLGEGEEISSIHFVDSNPERICIFAINSLGEYYKTSITDVEDWGIYNVPLFALPHSKSDQIMVRVCTEDAIVKVGTSDGSTMIDLNKFIKISRAKESCKYKIKLKPRTTVTEVIECLATKS